MTSSALPAGMVSAGRVPAWLLARWIVSPFGEVAWVKNYRANNRATLRRGRTRRHITLAEVRDDRKPEVLRAYRRAYRAVPFVRVAFEATAASPLAAFEAEAERHPVFLVSRTE